MPGRPCGWFLRVALAAAALLRPEQRARLLVARSAPRARSQAPGKCATSPQPPGLCGQPSALPRGPKPRPEGQRRLGRRPGRGLSPRRARGASITVRAGGSPAGSAVRRCQPRPQLSRRVFAGAAPSLLPAALLARGSQSHSSLSLPLRLPKLFFLPEEKTRLYPEALYSFRTPPSQASTGSSPRAFVLLFICHY